MRRRGFLGLAALGLVPAPLRAKGRAKAVLLVDPALPASRRQAQRARVLGTQVLPVEGDRVRLARAVAEAKPERIGGVTNWADFLLLSGTAEEMRYRLVSRTVERGTVSWVLNRRI